ncbi:MAG: SGNH/GDSL hydrolase family protein [Pseudomonadota bacterium]
MADAPKTITESELRAMLMDPGVPDSEIAPYLMDSSRDSGSFAPVVVPNPAYVTPSAEEGAVLLNSVNRLARWRRGIAYRRKIDGWSGRKLVSEGDSWFQYPLMLEDVIDQLGDRYAIRSLGAAGDLISDIDMQDELIATIAAERPDGVLLSGGGNDLLGDGRLVRALEPFDPAFDLEDYVTDDFEQTLVDVVDLYRGILQRVATAFPGLPVFCHGYDHALPARGRWLGKPLERLGIADPHLQRALVAHLVDRFYEELHRLAAEPGLAGMLEVIDCRGVVQGDWHDELHPTDEGYARVADLFHARIEARLGGGALEAMAAPLLAEGGVHAAAAAAERMAASMSDDMLVAEIGRRALVTSVDPSRAVAMEANVSEAALEGMGDFFHRIGRRLLKRLNRELHDLLCGEGEDDKADRKALGAALDLGPATVAAALVQLLTVSFGLAPAVATVVAAVVMKRVLGPTLEETCAVWGDLIAEEA